MINMVNLLNSIVYSLVGILILAAGFYIWDRLTPRDLWKEIIENKNTALAIVVAAITLGISLIVAAAVHG